MRSRASAQARHFVWTKLKLIAFPLPMAMHARALVLVATIGSVSALQHHPLKLTSLRVQYPARPAFRPPASRRREVASWPRASPPEMMYRMGPGGGGPGFDWASLLPPIFLGYLFASGAAWWLFSGLFNFFFLFAVVLPAVVVPIAQWWLSNNLVEGICAECGSPVQGIKGQRIQCMTCGALLSSDLDASGVFLREGAVATESGVVDIEVDKE